MCFAALSNGTPEANEFKKYVAPLGAACTVLAIAIY
jgi:hypothetical protein